MEGHAPSVRPAAASTGCRRSSGPLDPAELARLARRLLTLAGTRSGLDADGWAWRAVEGIALRLLQTAETTSSEEPGGTGSLRGDGGSDGRDRGKEHHR